MGKPLIDRIGQKYGRLTVVARAENYRGNARWTCKCECGGQTTTLGNDLRRNKVKSCGCLNAENHIKHGMSRTKVYNVWKQIFQRCNNPKCPSYKHYGERGIGVCPEWQDFSIFLEDMGLPPKGYTLERIDNDDGYKKSNCRWASYSDQANNKRNSRNYQFRGKTQTLMQWSDELGINWYTLRQRIDRYGWSVERAFTTPVKNTQ